VRHAAWFFALTLAGQAASAPARIEVAPREVAWDELSPAAFDLAWTLPDTNRRGDTLSARMRELAALTFVDRGRTRRLGDLVAEAHAIATSKRKGWFRTLDERAPELMAAWGHELRELLLDERLLAADWDPADDDARDGLLAGDTWTIDAGEPGPWDASRVSPAFEQAAALLPSDLATLKSVENDYGAYPDHVGTDYESVKPVRGGHLTGRDADGRAFRFVRIRSRADLSFPFGGYTCDLRILNRVDDRGRLRTDIWSPSADFHYFVGRDLFLPVEDSLGRVAAFLVVRDFGFDLVGVPDRSRHRREALWSTLGNLKRNVELRLAAGEPSEPGSSDPERVLDSLRVFGRR